MLRCLLVRAAQQDGRERHMAWAVDFNMDDASDDDFDTATEVQAGINEEWTNIMVVWVNGDRRDPEEPPAATAEVVARNVANRLVRARRQPNWYSDARNTTYNRRSHSSSESEEDASDNVPSDGRDAEDNEVIELLSSDDDDDPPFPTRFDEDVAHSQLRKQISHLIDMMFRRQNRSGQGAYVAMDEYVAQLIGRMYRELRDNGGKKSGQKRKSTD